MPSSKARADEAHTATGPCGYKVQFKSDAHRFCDRSIDVTCHKPLVPEGIDRLITIRSALKLCGRIVRIDLNMIQVSHIDFNAVETGDRRCQGVATADRIKRNIVIIGISNLRGVRISLVWRLGGHSQSLLRHPRK